MTFTSSGPIPTPSRPRAPPPNQHFIVPHFLPPHRALLGLYLPGVLTEALVSALPAELGAYVATSSEPIRMSGELRVLGQQVSGSYIDPDLTLCSSLAPQAQSACLSACPPTLLHHLPAPLLQLSTYVAGLHPAPAKPTSDAAKREAAIQALDAASRARSLLGLTEPQAQALAELFNGLVPGDPKAGTAGVRGSGCSVCVSGGGGQLCMGAGGMTPRPAVRGCVALGAVCVLGAAAEYEGRRQRQGAFPLPGYISCTTPLLVSPPPHTPSTLMKDPTTPPSPRMQVSVCVL